VHAGTVFAGDMCDAQKVCRLLAAAAPQKRAMSTPIFLAQKLCFSRCALLAERL
jgi:hypothetical protein